MYGHGFTGEDVGFFGSLYSGGATITACSVSSTPSSAILNGACSLTSGPGSTVTFNGTFTVGIDIPGDYLIVVSGLASVGGSTVSGAVAQQVLVVDTGPVLQLMPSKGSVGTSVQFNATWLQPSDTSCTVSSPSGGAILTGAACSTFPVQNITIGGAFGGAHSGFFTQNATGSFIVGNVASGQYVIQVRGSSGDLRRLCLTS